MLILKMALRNLRRNLRRSLITGLSICFGLALLIVSSGIGDGAHGAMIEKGLAASAGHVVIQGRGWQEQRDNRIVVPGSAAMVKQVQSLLPEARILSRVYLQGLLTSPTGSVGIGLSGIVPDKEIQVSDLHTKIVKGQYLGTDPRGIVLGQTLAETLGVDLGDKVVLMVQRGPDIQNQLFRVQGVFRAGIEEIDGFYGQILIGAAQQILGLGDDVTQIAVFVDSYRNAPQAWQTLHGAIDDAKIDILPWQKAMPDLHMWITLDDAGLYMMILIIAIVVLLGIVNTMLMSVLERSREFGIMLALGLSPKRLAALVFSEAALLGLFAVLIGLALGLLGNWPLASHGLDLSEMMGGDVMEAGGVALDMVFKSDLAPHKVLLFCLISYLMTLAAAVYPTFKAISLQPIEAMRPRQ